MLEAKLSSADLLKKVLEGESEGDRLPTPLLPRIALLTLLALSTTAAVKELVTEASFDCSDEGIVRSHLARLDPTRPLIPSLSDPDPQKLQAMDNSHVALVALELKQEQFEAGYRCDHNMSLGMNIASLQKIVKCAGNDDTVTIRADESADVLQLLFESKSERPAFPFYLLVSSVKGHGTLGESVLNSIPASGSGLCIARQTRTG